MFRDEELQAAEGPPHFTQRLTYNAEGSLQYQGWALPGSATSAAVWLIVEHTYDAEGLYSGVIFAAGRAKFTAEWDERANYVYL